MLTFIFYLYFTTVYNFSHYLTKIWNVKMCIMGNGNNPPTHICTKSNVKHVVLEFCPEFRILIKCWVESCNEHFGWRFLTTDWPQLIHASCLFILSSIDFMQACSSVCKSQWFCLPVVVSLSFITVLALCCFFQGFCTHRVYGWTWLLCK